MLELADIFRDAGPAYVQAHAERMLPSHRLPHAHLLVTAGGRSPDGTAWVKPAHARFLMPGYALSEIFRAKLRDAVVRAGVDGDIDSRVWKQSWTVHLQQIGRGERAAHYLSRYVYHVALTNHRLDRFAHDRVTFQYTHARTQETRRVTLPVDTFIGPFLQHVLSRGFTKIRYSGLLSPTGRTQLERARSALDLHAALHARPSAVANETTAPRSPLHDSGNTNVDSLGVPRDTASLTVAILVTIPAARACTVCGRGQVRVVERWRRSRAPPS